MADSSSKDLTDVFKEFDDKEVDKTDKKEEREPEEKAPAEDEKSPPEEEKETPEEKTPEEKTPSEEKPPEKEPIKEEKLPEPPKEETSTIPKEGIPDKYKKYDFSPAKKTGKHCVVIYGLKGAGKTYLSLSTPGTHFALTFDNKTQSVAGEMDNPERIVVYDGVKYYDRSSPDTWIESAEDSWIYIQGVLDGLEHGFLEDEKGNILERPDWILVDGGEIVHTMLEMVMRGRNSLMPFQGIQNRNVWKERRMYIGELFKRCMQTSKKGVIWTSYIDKDEIKEEGDYVSIQDIPRWIDAVLYETDVLIKALRKTGKTSQEFGAIVESSKWKAIPETSYTDITGKGMDALIKDMELFNKEAEE